VDDTTVALVLLVGAGLVLLVVAVVLFLRFWRLRRQLATLPEGGRFAFWGAVVYTLFPVDVLPDPIVLDDVGVLLAASAYLHRLIRERDARRRMPVRRPARPPRPELPAGERAPRREVRPPRP
jgi:uncharacterized membrane protein YkvA (DUF1232 family)